MTADAWMPPHSGVEHNDLKLWNMAMSHMNASIPIGGSDTSLRLSPIASPHLVGPLQALRSTQGDTFYVHLDSFPYLELMGVDFDLKVAKDIPPALADAICAGSTEFLLQKFPDTLTAGIVYQGVQTDTIPDADDLKWFAAALDGLTETPVFFSIGGTTSDICAFLKERLSQPLPVLTLLRETLDAPLYRMIGRASLSLDAVRNLEVGDFVVLEDAPSDDLIVRCYDRALYLEAAQDGWLCTAIHPFEHFRKMPTMHDAVSGPQDPLNESTVDPEDTAEPRLDIAELVSTVLTFECGQTRMTLAELESLQTGVILALPDQLTKDGVQVTIRAGEHPIGTGEIVKIDDRVAVRISDLLTSTS